MYGLTDDMADMQRDIETLQDVIKTLLPHAPIEQQKLVLMLLKERGLKPYGLKVKSAPGK
jgi:hypothetical protein